MWEFIRNALYFCKRFNRHATLNVSFYFCNHHHETRQIMGPFSFLFWPWAISIGRLDHLFPQNSFSIAKSSYLIENHCIFQIMNLLQFQNNCFPCRTSSLCLFHQDHRVFLHRLLWLLIMIIGKCLIILSGRSRNFHKVWGTCLWLQITQTTAI